MKKKYIYLSFCLFFFALGIILSHTYRPYIYKNHIFDFHLADTIGNWIGVPAAVNCGMAFWEEKASLLKLVVVAVFTFIGYEILHFSGTFDWYDIIASIISGVITYFVMRLFVKQETV